MESTRSRGTNVRQRRLREWPCARALALKFVVDLTEGLSGRILDVAATAQGHGLALVVSNEDWQRATARVEDPGSASFATTRVDPPYSSDCYALNVADDETWTCYYTDFPVVRVADGEITSWRNALRRGERIGGRR